jgi:hypothetical protein
VFGRIATRAARSIGTPQTGVVAGLAALAHPVIVEPGRAGASGGTAPIGSAGDAVGG